MAEPAGALVSCFCSHHVGRPNLLLHLAGRPIYQAREECSNGRHRPVDMDGPQWRLLHCRQTAVLKGGAGPSSMVSLGSVNDLAERDGAACSRLLFQQWAHRSDIAEISQARGIAIGLAVLVVGWVVYDLAVRSSLGKSGTLFAAFSLLMIALLAYGLSHVFSARAAYIHVGAVLGTIMTANVWFRILPSQRKMVAAAAAGKTFDASLGAQAKLRSKHNTFMAVPVVFIMISNHFPVATYGNTYGWEILVVLVLLGWGAAKVIREA